MEIVVQEVVNRDKHTVQNMTTQHLCTPCAPGCGYLAPHQGTSIPSFLLCLLQCRRNLSSLDS